MTEPIVVNLYHEDYDVYIGRPGRGQPGPLGNPFPATESREKSIAQFEHYARNSPALLELIKNIPARARLGCFCKPKSCHGDVIVKLWKELRKEAA